MGTGNKLGYRRIRENKRIPPKWADERNQNENSRGLGEGGRGKVKKQAEEAAKKGKV